MAGTGADEGRAEGRDEDRIAVDDPRNADVRVLLERHLRFARTHSPPEDVHALDVEDLCRSDVTLFAFRRRGELLAVGAIKELAPGHAELKSMHTAESARRQGVGRAMVGHLLAVARRRGVRRVSLETGSTAPFAPARSLYAGAGFSPCGPFGDYVPSPHSAFMTLVLAGEGDEPDGDGDGPDAADEGGVASGR